MRFAVAVLVAVALVDAAAEVRGARAEGPVLADVLCGVDVGALDTFTTVVVGFEAGFGDAEMAPSCLAARAAGDALAGCEMGLEALGVAFDGVTLFLGVASLALVTAAFFGVPAASDAGVGLTVDDSVDLAPSADVCDLTSFVASSLMAEELVVLGCFSRTPSAFFLSPALCEESALETARLMSSLVCCLVAAPAASVGTVFDPVVSGDTFADSVPGITVPKELIRRPGGGSD